MSRGEQFDLQRSFVYGVLRAAAFWGTAVESCLMEIAAHFCSVCATSADPVGCLEARMEQLRAQNRWTESQLADIEKQALRMLYEVVTRRESPQKE